METDLNNSKHLKLAFWLGAIFFLFTAINSHGYYHADEHYQIIEFAGKLLGTHQPHELAWEYTAQIRPSIQIFLAATFIKGFNLIGINDPYTQASLLRLITALFSLVVIHKLVKHLCTYFKSNFLRILFIYSSFLIWFAPYLGVRFSSESWSGLLFSLGVVSFWTSDAKSKKRHTWLGLHFGLAFLFRYQIAFAEIAIVTYWLLKSEIKLKGLITFSTVFIIVLCAGILLDSIYYQDLTIAPWNYFKSNILESKAAFYGISPFTYYLETLLYFPSIALGIIFYFSMLSQLILKRNIIFWAFITFLIAHSMVGHKEERFLFPMLLFFPFLLLYGYELILQKSKSIQLKNMISSVLILCISITSIIGLPTLASISAGKGDMALSKYIHESKEGKKQLIYMDWSNPYTPFGLIAKFYAKDNVESTHLQNLCDLNKEMIIPNRKTYLALRLYDLEHSDCKDKLAELGFKLTKRSIPNWVNQLNEYYGGYQNHVTILLYEK